MMKNIFSGNSGIYLAFFATACVLTLLMPDKGKFKYEYQKGQPWMYETLTAPIDFPILKSEEELRKEREALSRSVSPYFVFRNNVEAEQIRNLSQQVKASPDSVLIFEQVLSILNDIYQRGVTDQNLPEKAITDGVVTLVQGTESYERPASEVFNPATAEAYLAHMLTPVVGSGREQILINHWHLRDYIVPNLRFDERTTMAVLGEKLADIAPAKGRVYTGQLIVQNGTVLDGETVQVLDSFRAEYNRSLGFLGNRTLLQLGQFLALLLCVTALYIIVSLLYPAIFRRRSFLIFILLQMPMMLLTAILLGNLNAGGLFMIPFAVFALYMAAFFPAGIVLPIYFIGLLPIVLIAPHGVEWLFLNVVAGAVAVFAFHYWNRGWLQFISAFIIFVTYTIGYLAFRLIENGSFSAINWPYVQFFFWNALLIIAVYPLVYLLERIFGFVSESRLKELSDTTTPLLQLLSEKAPGTMQHSLQVANMAEVAARDIGANALLARVGALYHDVGKINNPGYFIENQMGEISPHQDLSPMESAKVIIGHVDQGMNLAKKYNLPKLVSDFILTHHGQAQSAYFYRKYCNEGGDPENINAFTYHGELPQAREQVIVMIADAVEASTRSLTNYSSETISNMVERMVSERLSDKQLSQADISIKEINRIKEIFKARLQEIYHQRIAYPEANKKDRTTNNKTST